MKAPETININTAFKPDTAGLATDTWQMSTMQSDRDRLEVRFPRQLPAKNLVAIAESMKEYAYIWGVASSPLVAHNSEQVVDLSQYRPYHRQLYTVLLSEGVPKEYSNNIFEYLNANVDYCARIMGGAALIHTTNIFQIHKTSAA